MDPLKGLVNDAEAAGEKLAAVAEANLKSVIETLLEKASDYKITFSVAIEKKA